MQLELFEDDTKEVLNNSHELLECLTCRELKPLTDYYHYEHRSKKPNGVHRNCKPCYNENTMLTQRLKKENPYPFKEPKCQCCGTVSTTEVLNLDHCHDTKVFRGWLCRSCNTGIGSLGDDIGGLENALVYLRKHYE